MTPSLCALAAGQLAAPARGSDEVRRVIDEVLADPEYSKHLPSLEVDEGLFRTFLRFLKLALEWIQGLGQALADLRSTQAPLFWTIMLAMIIVLVLLLWHIGYSISLAFRSAPGAPLEEAQGEEAPPHFRQLWGRAGELAAAGDYTEAIRHLLLALLVRLEAGKITLLPGWTNREIVERLRLDGERRSSLASLVSTADRCWYGRRTASAEDYRRSLAAVGAFLEREAPGDEAHG